MLKLKYRTTMYFDFTIRFFFSNLFFFFCYNNKNFVNKEKMNDKKKCVFHLFIYFLFYLCFEITNFVCHKKVR